MITEATHGAKVTAVVKRTQEAVNTWMRIFPSNKPPGWEDLVVTGKYDAPTHAAVELYQGKVGLEKPGGLDGLTLAVLSRFNPNPGRILEIVPELPTSGVITGGTVDFI